MHKNRIEVCSDLEGCGQRPDRGRAEPRDPVQSRLITIYWLRCEASIPKEKQGSRNDKRSYKCMTPPYPPPFDLFLPVICPKIPCWPSCHTPEVSLFSRQGGWQWEIRAMKIKPAVERAVQYWKRGSLCVWRAHRRRQAGAEDAGHGAPIETAGTPPPVALNNTAGPTVRTLEGEISASKDGARSSRMHTAATRRPKRPTMATVRRRSRHRWPTPMPKMKAAQTTSPITPTSNAPPSAMLAPDGANYILQAAAGQQAG